MKPLLLLFCLSLAATGAAAQAGVNFQGYSVNGGFAWVLRYKVDHGSSPQAVTLNFDINSQSAAGVNVHVLDVDDKYAAGGYGEASGMHPGTGHCMVSMTTDVRAGVHPVLLIVQSSSGATATFDGVISVNAGNIVADGQMQTARLDDGLFYPYGLYATFNEPLTTTAHYSTNVVLDFGGAAQTPTLRFEGVGSGLTELRLYDVTGGDVLVKTLLATGGNLSSWDWVTTASYSGEVEFRVEVEGNGSAGDVFWALWLPPEVTAVSGSGDGVAVPATGHSKGGGGGGCVAGARGNLAALALLGVLAMLVSLRGFRTSDS